MNVHIRSKIFATLVATLAGFIGNQILGQLSAPLPGGWPIGLGLILATIAIGAVVLKAVLKSTPLWAALLANAVAALLLNRLFATGTLVPSSRGVALNVAVIILSYWIAQFAALTAIEMAIPRLTSAKRNS